MSRIIKFRFWDRHEKKMIQADELVFWSGCVYRNESKRLNDASGKPARLKGYSVIEDFLMQFTGLQDKNGVDIYEGDIVKDTKFVDGTGKVVFWFGSFMVFYTNALGSYHLLDRLSYEPVVIGNIHENPELLEGGAK